MMKSLLVLLLSLPMLAPPGACLCRLAQAATKAAPSRCKCGKCKPRQAPEPAQAPCPVCTERPPATLAPAIELPADLAAPAWLPLVEEHGLGVPVLHSSHAPLWSHPPPTVLRC